MESNIMMFHVADNNADDKRLSKYIDYLYKDGKKMRAEIKDGKFLIWEEGKQEQAVLSNELEYYEAISQERMWKCTYDEKSHRFTHTASDNPKEVRYAYFIHYKAWDGSGYCCFIPMYYKNDQKPICLRKATDYQTYLDQTKLYQSMDQADRMAADVTLSEEEEMLDTAMKKLRNQATNGKYVKGTHLLKSVPDVQLNSPPLHPFYDAKAKLLEDLKVQSLNNQKPETVLFRVFQQMPKGGNLHIHTSATLSIEGLIQLLLDIDPADGTPGILGADWQVFATKEDLAGENNTKILRNTLFLINVREGTAIKNGFVRFSDIKKDEQLLQTFQSDLCFMYDEDVKRIQYIWDAFHDAFSRVSTILKIEEFYKEYYIRAFQELIDDHIDYVELRYGLPTFDPHACDVVLESQTPNTDAPISQKDDENPFAVMQEIYQQVRQKDEKNADFKLKLIVSGNRGKGKEPAEVVKQIEAVYDYIYSDKPLSADGEGNFIIGYDLVGEEDRGNKTEDYAQEILQNEKAKQVPFYFHDGESCWADDDNVYSAFALGTRRIGHGLNLFRFPTLVGMMEYESIALEVCPISNQLLRYTSDLRMHPIGEYIKRGIPCVICSDDPLILGNPGLSYDFWEMYMGQLLGLKEIKKLIMNSYQYSGMDEEEKEAKLRAWEDTDAKTGKWTQFVKDAMEMLGIE